MPLHDHSSSNPCQRCIAAFYSLVDTPFGGSVLAQAMGKKEIVVISINESRVCRHITHGDTTIQILSLQELQGFFNEEGVEPENSKRMLDYLGKNQVKSDGWVDAVQIMSDSNTGAYHIHHFQLRYQAEGDEHIREMMANAEMN